MNFLRLIEEYIISLDPPAPSTTLPQTNRASAYRALAHGPQPGMAKGGGIPKTPPLRIENS